MLFCFGELLGGRDQLLRCIRAVGLGDLLELLLESRSTNRLGTLECGRRERRL